MTRCCWLAIPVCAGLLAVIAMPGCGESAANSPQARADASKEGSFESGQPRGNALLASQPLKNRSGSHAAPKEITFDTIKFEMTKGEPFFRSMLTPQIEALEGQPVRIRGYILPSFQQTGITQFVLVRDNLECCFGPGAALFDCIVVDMKPGKTTSYSVRPVTVSGTFTIRELLDPDGKHLAIYHLEGDAVQ
jgi:hypothetical protein